MTPSNVSSHWCWWCCPILASMLGSRFVCTYDPHLSSLALSTAIHSVLWHDLSLSFSLSLPFFLSFFLSLGSLSLSYQHQSHIFISFATEIALRSVDRCRCASCHYHAGLNVQWHGREFSPPRSTIRYLSLVLIWNLIVLATIRTGLTPAKWLSWHHSRRIIVSHLTSCLTYQCTLHLELYFLFPSSKSSLPFSSTNIDDDDDDNGGIIDV